MFRNASDERQDHIRKQLGLMNEDESPGEVEYDDVAGFIIEAYLVIERSRKYTETGCPLPLSMSDVAPYLACHDIAIPASEFVSSLFKIDDVWLEKRYEAMENK